MPTVPLIAGSRSSGIRGTLISDGKEIAMGDLPAGVVRLEMEGRRSVFDCIHTFHGLVESAVLGLALEEDSP